MRTIVVAMAIVVVGRAGPGPYGAAAQTPGAPDPVTWALEAPKAPVGPGRTMTLRLTAAIADGWHLYAMAQPPGGPISTEISLHPNQPFSFAKPIVASKPATIQDPNFDMRIQLYAAKATFTLPLAVAASAHPGRQTVTVDARYQSCNDVICLPPTTKPVRTIVEIR